MGIPSLKLAANQSHDDACCGCRSCDARGRAMIVVNAISMCFAVFVVLSMMALMSSNDYAVHMDDDQMDGATVGWSIPIAATGIFCNASGIFGARKFNQWAVLIAGSWYMVELLRSLAYSDIGCAIMAGLFVYPHVIFWQEMRQGMLMPAKCQHSEQCSKRCS